jgi:hypothetical protein
MEGDQNNINTESGRTNGYKSTYAQNFNIIQSPSSPTGASYDGRNSMAYPALGLHAGQNKNSLDYIRNSPTLGTDLPSQDPPGIRSHTSSHFPLFDNQYADRFSQG